MSDWGVESVRKRKVEGIACDLLDQVRSESEMKVDEMGRKKCCRSLKVSMV